MAYGILGDHFQNWKIYHAAVCVYIYLLFVAMFYFYKSFNSFEI